MGKQKTINYFVWLRALGAVSVVLLHAFIAAHAAPGTHLGVLRLTIDGFLSITLTRWAVPVFFMMSGALMLDPNREMGWRKLLRHVWRLGFVLLAFGFPFCLAESYVHAGQLSLSVVLESLGNLLSAKSWDHLWFVYQLLGFYLVTPVLRPWVMQAGKDELRSVSLWCCLLLLGLKGASAFMPFTFYDGLGLPQCFAYYLLGSYVHRHAKLDVRVVMAGIVSLACMSLAVRYRRFEFMTDPSRGFVAPYAVMLMLAAKRWLDRPVKDGGIIALLADYSFGIYLVHPIFQHLLVMYTSVAAWPAVICTATMVLVPLAASIALVWLLRKLPGFSDKL